jgi:hypothetical protein
MAQPPSLREWLPGDHLAWFAIDAVQEMDLRGSTRPTGGTVMGGRMTRR